MTNSEAFRSWLKSKISQFESPAELSRKTGISQPTLSNWLSGKWKSLSETNVERLCSFFDLNKTDLLSICEVPSVARESGPVWNMPTTADPRRRLIAEWVIRDASDDHLRLIECVMHSHAEKKGGESAAPGSAHSAAS